MGSLFKARDYWSVRFAEEFEPRACLVGNIDNNPQNLDRIAVGSLQGTLRIFSPKGKGYQPDDLLLEHHFGAPILQLSVGAFIPNTAKSFVVLQPKKLVFATLCFTVRDGPKEEGDPLSQQVSLRIDVEHPLVHTAYNLAHGAFGGGAGQSNEVVCVQSMDGQLAFFDHRHMLFERFIPSTHFLLPGQLRYTAKLDSFLTNSSALELHCYKYSTFAQSLGSETKEERSGRKIAPDWSFNVGEDVVDIVVCRLSQNLPTNQVDLVVLCERTMYILKDTGELRFNRRLDVPASALAAYVTADGRRHNVIVGTFNNALHVYDDKALLWSAMLPAPAMFVGVATLCKVQGMILTVTDDGAIAANYLGTDPATNPIQVLESKDLDYDAMDAEHRRLQHQIRQAVMQTRTEPKDLMKLSTDPAVIQAPYTTCSVALKLQYSGSDDLHNVTVIVNASEPIVPESRSIIVPYIPAREVSQVPLTFVLEQEGSGIDRVAPSSLLVDVLVVFTTLSRETFTATISVVLPITLIGSITAPIKNSAFKVQLSTNREPPSLSALFADLAATGEVGSNVLSVQYRWGGDATILVSKNGGRYRVQSSTFEGLWMLSSELLRRLKFHFKGESPKLVVEFTDELPLDDYFQVVDAHFRARVAAETVQQGLGQLAHQFRAIQKRLLVRYKDRNPASLVSIQTLFEDTYRRVNLKADEVEAAMVQLTQASHALSCATHLMLLLLRYKFPDLRPDDFDVLKAALSPVVVGGGTGWEETTDAAMMHLLRTVLSRNAKEGAAAPQPLQRPSDTSKLQKHIILVIDRIGKGGHLVERSTKMDTEVVDTKRKA